MPDEPKPLTKDDIEVLGKEEHDFSNGKVIGDEYSTYFHRDRIREALEGLKHEIHLKGVYAPIILLMIDKWFPVFKSPPED